MFGYVRPADGHLTAEDKSRFQAAYCGLCRSLGRRYGLAARMILNYDLAFLAMLLSREPECLTAHCRCPAHPDHRRHRLRRHHQITLCQCDPDPFSCLQSVKDLFLGR